MINIVDFVAGTMPWTGSLVPATIIYRNVQTNLGMKPAEALIIGLVVEGIGFVTVTTALDLHEQSQVEEQARSGASVWVAIGGVVVYIVVVELVNAILSDGDAWHKLTLGLLSSFGLLGGLMVALRNQLSKRRAASQKQRDEDAAEKARALEIQEQIDRENRAFEHELRAEKLRLAHELKLKKLESSTQDNIPERSEKVSKGAETFPETFGKWKDWRKVPENVRKDIAKLQSAEEVSERYGVSLKVGGLWLKRAQGGQ